MGRFDADGVTVTKLEGYGGGLMAERLLLPAMRASITGLAVGLLVGVLMAWYSWPRGDAVAAGAIASLVSFLLCWLWPRGKRSEPVYPEVPSSEGDGGGHIALLNPRPETQLQDNEAERFRLFVRRAAIDSGSRALRGAGFTDAEIAQYRTMLLRSGWAEWRAEGSKAQGWELVGSPEQILEAVR